MHTWFTNCKYGRNINLAVLVELSSCDILPHDSVVRCPNAARHQHRAILPDHAVRIPFKNPLESLGYLLHFTEWFPHQRDKYRNGIHWKYIRDKTCNPRSVRRNSHHLHLYSMHRFITVLVSSPRFRVPFQSFTSSLRWIEKIILKARK